MSSDPCQAIILPQRYDMIASKVGQMLPNPEGHWVCHTSYEKLADRWQAQREHIRHLHKKVADLEAEVDVFRNPEKFPNKFAEMCFLSGYKQGLKDAAKGVQS